MLPHLPLRFLLADDPGAGKTIMTGLLVKELIHRKRLDRCIIVSPGVLAEQWQEELAEKFSLGFSLLSDDTVPQLCIARLDSLARNKDILHRLEGISWDLVVFDEAHKLSAQLWGNRISYTKRFHVGETLTKSASNTLMLTATPHNGKAQDYRLFMSLINRDAQEQTRRLLKEDIITFTGERLFPEREAITVSYKLSDQELSLYEHVTEYVRNEFNRAENLKPEYRRSIGFALTILQRRLASSPEAICSSLNRRLDRLQAKLDDALRSSNSEVRRGIISLDQDQHDYDDSDDSDSAADFLTASGNTDELAAEIRILQRLDREASNLVASGKDKKWQELSRLLMNNSLISHDGKREKLIIFTEHRDTLLYLARRISELLGNNALVTIHGGMSRTTRRENVTAFMNDVDILIATDAAGEGINLQSAHLVINYDLPWNPNRLEQRFGRVHRIGQHNTCYLWNLVAGNTREGKVFERLLTKINEEKKALGGKVFDVLGRLSFGGKSLDEMIREAVFQEKTTYFIRGHVQALVKGLLMGSSTLSLEHARELGQELDNNRSQLLPPEVIETFFVPAFSLVNAGTIYQDNTGIYRIPFVNPDFIAKDHRIKEHYPRICFDRRFSGELIIQGHPLLEAVISEILKRHSESEDDDEASQTTPEGRDSIEQAAINAVMNIERRLGNSPRDVGAYKLGYDIESTSQAGTTRFIEVKGRKSGARSVTVTAGEISFMVMHSSRTTLAIVEVDGNNTHTKYLSRPFKDTPDDTVISITYNIASLVNNSECLYSD